MTASPNSAIDAPIGPPRGLSPVQYAALAVAGATLGLSTIWTAVSGLWTTWTTDALKSIGMILPVVSLVLILRAWRRLGWCADGTWWGLVVVLSAIAAVWTQQRAILLLVITPHWTTPLPPPSLVLFAFGSGVVLLFGGTRLYRAASFPILLLLLANPVPHAFGVFVDLPLQTASAHIARSFAMHLGQPLTPDHLRLMFTPDFGMFIAPGCNGIRGAVTMGYIALIAGYVYRFRWYSNALVVVGAVLLGYVFNLVRLCLLVLYYLVALHFRSLQDKAEDADYVIGAALFLCATILLFTVIQLLGDGRHFNLSNAAPSSAPSSPLATVRSKQYATLSVMTVVALLGCAVVARTRAEVHPSNAAMASSEMQRFPHQLGKYTLVRTWNEALVTGPVVYVWAQYTPGNGGRPIALGVSPLVGWQHDPLMCHTTRGDHPLWQGQLTVQTGDRSPVDFSSAFYTDGVIQSLEASTQCSSVSCGEFATERTHFGLVYSRPDPRSLLTTDTQQTLPVLVRAETPDLTLTDAVARQLLTQDLRTFLASVKLTNLSGADAL